MKKLLAVTAATAMMATTAFAGSHSNIKTMLGNRRSPLIPSSCRCGVDHEKDAKGHS